MDETRELRPLLNYPDPVKFPYRFRPPHWLPDTLVQTDEVPFQEEALKYRDEFTPFGIPKYKGKDFEDPPANAPAAEWNDFHKWILGWPLNPPGEGTSPFHEFLTATQQLCRNWNASLYRLRRLHFHDSSAAGATPMQWNPTDGSPQVLPADITPLLGPAYDDWKETSHKLSDHLRRGYIGKDGKVKHVIADMIRINDYIVSIRMIGEINRTPNGPEEYGGASSSHNSLSSGFSSSSSSSSPSFANNLPSAPIDSVTVSDNPLPQFAQSIIVGKPDLFLQPDPKDPRTKFPPVPLHPFTEASGFFKKLNRICSVVDPAVPASPVEDGRLTRLAPGWSEDLQRNEEQIRHIQSSVGRMEFGDGSDYGYNGVGFAVGDKYILTNAHIADNYDAITNLRVDFSEDGGLGGENRSTGVRILAYDNLLDYALIEVRHGPTPPPGLTLHSCPDWPELEAVLRLAPQNPLKAFAVHYPGKPHHTDPFPTTEERENIFQNKWDRKTFSPGLLRALEPVTDQGKTWRLFDGTYPTARKSSGAPVCLLTGGVISLHHSGWHQQANYSTPMWLILEDLKEKLKEQPEVLESIRTLDLNWR